jgi:periplasmic divalent cation tolerance protein
MKKFIQITTTMSSQLEAKRISRKLLQARLAACVQVIGPINSHYRWKGKIEHAKEWMCIIKARSGDYSMIETIVRKAHSYDVPEILASPILEGNPGYLKWLSKETER